MREAEPEASERIGRLGGHPGNQAYAAEEGFLVGGYSLRGTARRELDDSNKA
jgi:hypothetical protein